MRIYKCKPWDYFGFKQVFKWSSLASGCRIESWLAEAWFVTSHFVYNVIVCLMQTVEHKFYFLIKQIYFIFIKKATCFGRKCLQKAIPYNNINRGTLSILKCLDFCNGKKILYPTTFFKRFYILTLYIPTISP